MNKSGPHRGKSHRQSVVIQQATDSGTNDDFSGWWHGRIERSHLKKQSSPSHNWQKKESSPSTTSADNCAAPPANHLSPRMMNDMYLPLSTDKLSLWACYAMTWHYTWIHSRTTTQPYASATILPTKRLAEVLLLLSIRYQQQWHYHWQCMVWSSSTLQDPRSSLSSIHEQLNRWDTGWIRALLGDGMK